MNNPATSKPPNYDQVIREILVPAEGSISTEDLADQILQRHASKARDPLKAALAKIHEEEGRQLVYLDADHILPLRLAYQGARYRIRLTKENIDDAALSYEKCFYDYLPASFDASNLHLIDSLGNPIQVQHKEKPAKAPFPSMDQNTYTIPIIVLHDWFRSQKLYFKDHILVTIENWEQGILRLERERYGERQSNLLIERNRLIADAFFAMLESAKYERVYAVVALPTTLARMPDKAGYPPDHWMEIVENDPRMVGDGWSIHYAEGGFNEIERIFAQTSGKSLLPQAQKPTKEAEQQIYRFRAQLTRKPSIWRVIEVQGKQTLEQLDGELRSVFLHDPSDHLSGFWKRVARSSGPRKRYREIDIGTVNPFEYGEGSDTPVASLELKVGARLKYVYDFGDWVEHTLELQSIGSPEKEVEYPREVSRNVPVIQYCIDCQKQGLQTPAMWVCITCSNEVQDNYVLCEACLEQHEDHYVEELLD